MLTKEQIARLIEIETSGKLTAHEVVEDARDPDSPLHACFEWDVEKAAEQHWLDRARELIREVRVVVTTTRERVEVPRYVRDPDLPGGSQGYSALGGMDAARQRMALANEIGRCLGYMRRALSIAAAVGLADDAMRDDVEAWQAWRDEIESRPTQPVSDAA